MPGQGGDPTEIWYLDKPIAADNPLPVSLGAGSSDAAAGPVALGQVGGFSKVVWDEFARPANATPYNANDVVGDGAVLTFNGAARFNGGTGHVIRARLMTDQVANVARYRLHLYTLAPTAIADNAPFTMLYPNRTIRIGVVTFPAVAMLGASGSTAVEAEVTNLRSTYDLPPGVDDIFGVLETLDVFTPTPSQQYFVELGCLAD